MKLERVCSCHVLLLLWLHILFIISTCLQAYQEMQLESAMPADQRTYCPYPECGFMLERPADPEDYADKPLECPYCDKPFCVTCGIMGGHKVRFGESCDRPTNTMPDCSWTALH